MLLPRSTVAHMKILHSLLKSDASPALTDEARFSDSLDWLLLASCMEKNE